MRRRVERFLYKSKVSEMTGKGATLPEMDD